LGEKLRQPVLSQIVLAWLDEVNVVTSRVQELVSGAV